MSQVSVTQLPLTFTIIRPGSELRVFSPITPAYVEAVVSSLLINTVYDPMPTWLLRKNVCVLAPFLFNSLEHGVVPSGFKSAYITPLLGSQIWTPPM